jgi:hypothetical protein
MDGVTGCYLLGVCFGAWNQLGGFAGTTASAGMPLTLFSQFPILDEALGAIGVMVCPMVDCQVGDALAFVAAKGARNDRVRQAIICTPDEDLGQCATGIEVVRLDRRRGMVRDESGIEAKFGCEATIDSGLSGRGRV